MIAGVVRRGIVAAGGVSLLAVAVVAWAADAPGAWKPCGEGCLERGRSRLEVRHGITGDAVVAAMKGEVVHDQDIEVGGKPGRLVVTFGDTLEAVAIVGTDAIALRAPLGEAGDAAHAWGAMVERLGGLPPDGPGGKLTLVNVDTDCRATVYVEGQAHTLEPGASQVVELASPRAYVEWQERDGDHRMAAALPGAEARIGCPPPAHAAPVAAAPIAAAVAAPDAGVIAVSVDASLALPVASAGTTPMRRVARARRSSPRSPARGRRCCSIAGCGASCSTASCGPRRVASIA